MGMACEVESRAVTGEHEATNGESMWGRQSNGTSDPKLNPEETAIILTSLSKGFSDGVAPLSVITDSDGDNMMESDSDEAIFQHRQGSVSSAVGKVHRVQQINFDGPQGSKLDFTDDAGFSHRFRNESNRVKSLVTKHISIEELRAHFDRPIIDVAKDFGICITLMKKICRRNGIKRWPHRQIRSLSKSIASMEAAMLSAHGSERERYQDQIVNLKMKRESVIADPNRDNSMHLKTSPTSSTHSGSSDQSDDSHSSFHKVSLQANYNGRASSQTFQVPSLKVENLATSSNSNTGLSKGGRWTSEEHAAFLKGIRLYGKDWRRVAQVVMTRSAVQTRTHAQKYLLKFAGRLPFDPDEMLKDQYSASMQDQHEAASVKPLASVLSPTSVTSSNPAAMTSVGDDCTSSEMCTSEKEQPPANHGESMAMILNGSPHVAAKAGSCKTHAGTSTLPPLLPAITMDAASFHQHSQQFTVERSFQHFVQREDLQHQQHVAP